MDKTKKPSDQFFTEFIKDFKAEFTIVSPGRINLIGEHTDYNQGYALPTAIDKNIILKFRKNDTPDTARIYSEKYKDFFEVNIKGFSKCSASWKNYILGVIDEINKRGKNLRGFDCIIESKLPMGAGISSSAALECGLVFGLNELFNLGFTKMEMVELSQMAENNFVGSNCGIMDQFASVMSKKNYFILLDCRSNEAKYIPGDLKSCKILLLNTNVSRNLAEGEYNSRRRDCEETVALIKEKYPEINSLRDVSFKMLQENRDRLSEKNFMRSLYVLNENERVLKSAEAIKDGDLREFGKLMYASHEGLQNNYEVSCPELDFLVNYSRDKDFIYGSRMMGGGFGGCTINLIEEDNIKDYIDEVSLVYQQKFNIELDAMTAFPSSGTSILEEDFE